MKSSSVLTVRIEPELLAALRRRASRSGRSVSAEVIDALRRDLKPVGAGKPRRTMGMFADFEAPELPAFKQVRADLSRRIAKRTGPSR